MERGEPGRNRNRRDGNSEAGTCGQLVATPEEAHITVGRLPSEMPTALA
jgi:hypothetical protein